MASKIFQPLCTRLSGTGAPAVATRCQDLTGAAQSLNAQISMSRTFTSQIIKPAKTQIITRNMTLKYSAPISSTSPSTHLIAPQRSVSESYHSQQDGEILTGGAPTGGVESKPKQRPLAVVMAWLLAGEKQLEKYRQLYLGRGYDVLTVRTSPLQFVFPESGSQKIAENMISFLARVTENYPKVLVHAFSVGAYQFSEVLVKLKANLSGPQSLTSPTAQGAAAQKVARRLTGVILDSAVDLSNAPPAVGRAVAPKSKLGQKAIELSLEGYLRLAERVATRHYRTAQEALFENPFRIPSLIIVSHRDKFATLEANENLAGSYVKAGIPVEFKVFSESPHVQHYRYYPTEYEQSMERFLGTLPLNQN